MQNLIRNELTTHLAEPLTIGQFANQVAAQAVFEAFRSRKAVSTILRHDNDLRRFAEYLAEVGLMPGGSLATDPEAWSGVTWGLVEGFIRWQLRRGFAVSTINVRLTTIKCYAKLAVAAGGLDRTEYALIRTVSGYRPKEARRIDQDRIQANLPTRFDRPGPKKKAPVSLTRTQADRLKAQPDSPQGRRDRLLMCLLLDHGLRCGEVALLTVEAFSLTEGAFTFYRPKVDRVQTHRLTADTLQAARDYFAQDALDKGRLLRASRRDGSLGKEGMSGRAITKRVRLLAGAIGVEGLSAHDCRHYWATQAARNGTPLDRLQDAGGWASPMMPLHYIERARIANEGVRLG